MFTIIRNNINNNINIDLKLPLYIQVLQCLGIIIRLSILERNGINLMIRMCMSINLKIWKKKHLGAISIIIVFNFRIKIFQLAHIFSATNDAI